MNDYETFNRVAFNRVAKYLLTIWIKESIEYYDREVVVKKPISNLNKTKEIKNGDLLVIHVSILFLY